MSSPTSPSFRRSTRTCGGCSRGWSPTCRRGSFPRLCRSSTSWPPASTRVLPVASWRTTTLHGRRAPISGSTAIALLASCGLQAPRILYGGSSRPSFFFMVAATSISVSTPTPSLASASVTFCTAAVGSRATVLPNAYLLMGSSGRYPPKKMGPPGRRSSLRLEGDRSLVAAQLDLRRRPAILRDPYVVRGRRDSRRSADDVALLGDGLLAAGRLRMRRRRGARGEDVRGDAHRYGGLRKDIARSERRANYQNQSRLHSMRRPHRHEPGIVDGEMSA